MIKKTFVVLLLVLLALGLIGCNNGSKDLPISTIRWELGSDGFTQFYTNDSQNCNFSFFTQYDNNKSNTYEIEAKKMSGYKNINFGMVFGASDKDNFYALLITLTGYYKVQKKIGGNYSEIIEWTSTDRLYSRYNELNTLKVTKSGSSYTIFLNGSQVNQFNDSSLSGDKIGFFVGVSSEINEDFPNSLVDVRFRRK